MLYLIPLSPTDGRDIYEMLQEIAPNDNGFHNRVCGMTYEQYRDWLENEYAVDHGRLEDWMVPQTSFWLYDDERPVGYGRLRHFLNDALREHSGHIGYAIRSSERRKGYGNAILTLLLKECQKLGMTEVQIGANADNIPSNRIIQRYGGILIRTGDNKNFYQIVLP